MDSFIKKFGVKRRRESGLWQRRDPEGISFKRWMRHEHVNMLLKELTSS